MFTCRRTRNFLSDTASSMGLWAVLLQRDFGHKVSEWDFCCRPACRQTLTVVHVARQIFGAITESTLASSQSQYRLFYTEYVKCQRNWTTGRPLSQGPMRFQMHIQQYAVCGNLVAVGSFDGTIRVGDVDTDAISEPFSERHDSAVTALFVQDDPCIVVSGTGLLPWMAQGTGIGGFRYVPRLIMCTAHQPLTASVFFLDRPTIKVWRMVSGIAQLAARGQWECVKTIGGGSGSLQQVRLVEACFAPFY